MKRKTIRIELVPTDLNFLACIGCGKFHCDFAVVPQDNAGEEPAAGLHRACVPLVAVKRKLFKDAEET